MKDFHRLVVAAAIPGIALAVQTYRARFYNKEAERLSADYTRYYNATQPILKAVQQHAVDIVFEDITRNY